LVFTSTTHADSVTLPLEGYYHPGRYMPVRVIGDPVAGKPNAIVVRGVETVYATVNSRSGEKIDATVPLMSIDVQTGHLSWQWLYQAGRDVYPALRPLGDRQRLVGYASVFAQDAAKMAGEIYPGCEAIEERLNAAQPLPGMPACWEALDLVATDGPTMQRIDEQHISSLLGAGVAFAVKADKPPLPHWPWKRAANGWWTLRYIPAGPAAATYNARAYAPVAGITEGWAPSMRRRYLLEGCGFVVVMLLLALWRPRYIVVMGILVTGAVAVAMLYWHQWQRPLRAVEGKIRVVTPDMTQDDDWAFFIAPEETFSRNRWVDTMKLVLPAPGALQGMEARVECFSNGDPDVLAFNILPHGKAAVLCRHCGPQASSISPNPLNPSPLERLVKDQYLTPGDTIVGQLPASPLISESYFPLEQWPAIVIRRSR
jgi:hypothetical protein